MEKILIVGCKRAMDDVCIGCSRCLVGFNRREGDFARYKDQDAEVMGLLNCGDCPGATIVSFDNSPVREIAYEDTEHYQVYHKFMKDRDKYLKAL